MASTTLSDSQHSSSSTDTAHITLPFLVPTLSLSSEHAKSDVASGQHTSSNYRDPNHGRFVAGDTFFNYEGFGSLREGEPLRLSNKNSIGLLLAAFFGGSVSTLNPYCFVPILLHHFSIRNPEAMRAVGFMVNLPSILGVSVGLLSDRFQLRHQRRKPFIIAGSSMISTIYVSIALLAVSGDPSDWWNRNVCIFLSALGTLAGVVAIVPGMAMIVEYAQREPLYKRGIFQSTVFLAYFSSQAIAAILLPTLLTYDPFTGTLLNSKLDLPQITLLMTGIALITIGLMILLLHEDSVERPSFTRPSLIAGVAELWGLLRQRVFAGILVGLCGSACFLSASLQSIQSAQMLWSGLTASSLPNITAVKISCQCVAVMIYRLCFVNTNWRWIAGLGTALLAISQLVLTTLTSFDLARRSWFYFVMTAFGAIPQGWLVVLLPMIATEVTNTGQEGAVVGLLLSFVSAASLAANHGWDAMLRLVQDDISPIELMLDSDSTRQRVFHLALKCFGMNLIGLVAVAFLPKQKIDAQQKRAFGGYSPLVRWGIVVTFLGLAVYDIATTIRHYPAFTGTKPNL